MDNAHAEVVKQDQEPAGMWELGREVVKGVSPDPVTPVTNQPVWEIWAIPYAKAPDTVFLEHSAIFYATLLSQKPNQPCHWRNAAFNN